MRQIREQACEEFDLLSIRRNDRQVRLIKPRGSEGLCELSKAYQRDQRDR